MVVQKIGDLPMPGPEDPVNAEVEIRLIQLEELADLLLEVVEFAHLGLYTMRNRAVKIDRALFSCFRRFLISSISLSRFSRTSSSMSKICCRSLR